ncbi:MAG: DedA family protein [Rhodobiaceae bacterium]|nr:DedA family protein [Rhodobiaceae bacterium]MCC0042223.1 DedA family protein [Rhodobiaceae bacterium]
MPADSALLSLAGLFVSAFTSATLLPGSSEGVLAGLLGLELVPAVLAVGVATLGNTLGSLVNWAIGRFLDRYREHPRFPASGAMMARAQRWYDRFGLWSLLASWVPVVGDPITVVAGLMRAPLVPVAAIVAFAKGVRYAIVTAGALAFF